MDMHPKSTVGGVNHLPLSSLRLLVPPLRLMSAFMWQVAQQRDVMQYEKLEEFVTLVTEMVPELLSSRQRTQLILGLRARLILELCNERTADLLTLQPHLDRIQSLTEQYSVCSDRSDDELEASDSNFVELVKTLLEDPFEKEHFFQEVFPLHYGPRYDTALQILVWEFVSRLEELLPVPDLTQTAAWLGAAPSVLEECGHAVLDPEQLKTLLQHQQHLGNLQTSHSYYYTADTILFTLSLPPKLRVVVDSCLDGDEDFDNGSKRLGDDVEEEEGEEEEEEDEDGSNGPERLGDDVEEEEEEGGGGGSNGGRELEEEAEGEIKDWERKEELEDKDDRERNDEQNEEGHFIDSVTAGLAGGGSPSLLLSCSLCPFTHRRMSQLHQHIRKEHLGVAILAQRKGHFGSKKAASGDPNLPEGVIGSKNRTHTCNECGKVYKILYNLTRHRRTHTLPFQCNQCGKKFSSKRLLEIHQRNHTGERPFICSYCGRGCISNATLKLHIRTHTGERPHCCTYCEKSFTQEQILKRHMRMHEGERNYLCSICGKAFLASGELMLHTRSHTGERPYTCQECGKAFSASCHLKRHMRSHTGERPYSCNECVKCFATSKDLKRHMLVHTGEKPHQCSKCEKRFSEKSNMKKHLKSHTVDEAKQVLQAQPCTRSRRKR